MHVMVSTRANDEHVSMSETARQVGKVQLSFYESHMCF